MKNQVVPRVVVLIIGATLLLCLAPSLDSVTSPKARASRPYSINRIAHPFPRNAFVLTNLETIQSAPSESLEPR